MIAGFGTALPCSYCWMTWGFSLIFVPRSFWDIFLAIRACINALPKARPVFCTLNVSVSSASLRAPAPAEVPIGPWPPTDLSNLTQPQLTSVIQRMFEHCKDQPAFKQHLRDFLVQLKEFGDSTDLYAEEKQAQDDDKAKNLRARQEAIPGLLNPHARNDDCMMGD